ncbi:FadR/GntR family transcriptional regulator [Agreia sp. Leaf283]|uniref:FadR/GntR family transcriptional regulator n=1 Tax=Agreia sp. Leaf283 TaxID=1736321 RepID=UPI000701B47F|nr:FCD domain-containing protein [Agreia sp. Leaf283]KQP56744.1 GntR family transcriptional regulator [Agreia sp. Leaf283]
MVSVQRESLSEQAARLLLDRIQAGEWEVGQKLPGETTLAPQLGVGRSTMREAIRQLAGRGILTTRQGSGVFVHAVVPVGDWDSFVIRATIASILEARIAVECEAAALAAERCTGDDLLAIRTALTRRGGEVVTVDARVDADMAFHRSIVAASQNELLTELFDTFAARSREAMVQMLELSGEPATQADQLVHAEIVEAVAAHDAVVARDLSRSHLEALRAAIAQHRP